jgi:negative regulator of flagellin synthesis FlgM
MINTNNSLDSVSTKSTRSKPASTAPEAKEPSTPAAPTSPKAGDQVVLSEQAQTIGRLQSKIDSAPDVNLDKVAEIRRAIAEGRFEINPERIAENMLNQQDLLG